MDWQWHEWLFFVLGVIGLLFIDLVVFHRHAEKPSLRSSAFFTALWFLLAVAFNFHIYQAAGAQKAIEFASGYLVEWSLSMDNVFIFAVVFRYFKVPIENQHKILFWGILGAIVLRLGFIIAGTSILSYFEWMMSIFGIILIFTGIKLMLPGDPEVNPEHNIVMRYGKRFLRVHPKNNWEHFTITENGKFYVTSMFMVLLVIESTDVLFAIDSVPAIFGITRDPFIVFSSNVAAILGLRSLYFMFAGIVDSFKYLAHGLSVILIYVGIKMNLEYWMADHVSDGHLIPPWASLVAIATILGLAIVASLIAAKHEQSLEKKV